MPSAVLQIVSAPSSSLSVRQAAAVYLKNRISRSWSNNDSSNSTRSSSYVTIHESDRLALKQNILHVLVSVPQQNVKVQLKTCFSTMTSDDFPDKWPQLLETIVSCIQSGDQDHVEGGLLALVEIMKVWR